MLYGGTYLTANTLDTLTSTIQNKPATLVTSGTAKFAASSTAKYGQRGSLNYLSYFPEILLPHLMHS